MVMALGEGRLSSLGSNMEGTVYIANTEFDCGIIYPDDTGGFFLTKNLR